MVVQYHSHASKKPSLCFHISPLAKYDPNPLQKHHTKQVNLVGVFPKEAHQCHESKVFLELQNLVANFVLGFYYWLR